MSTAISPESVLKMTVKTTCKFLITVRFLDFLSFTYRIEDVFLDIEYI